jgi:hypothetical protein
LKPPKRRQNYRLVLGPNYRGATLPDPVDFTGATFTGTAKFLRATFSAPADFSDATFFGTADFSNATFSKSVDFGDPPQAAYVVDTSKAHVWPDGSDQAQTAVASIAWPP